MRALDRVGAALAGQRRCRQEQQADVDQASDAQRPVDVDAGRAQQAREVSGGVVGVAGGGAQLVGLVVVDQRGVQIDRVRHDGCAQHGSGHEDRVGALETRDEPAEHARGAGRCDEEARQEAQRDDDQQADDDRFELPLSPAALNEEQSHGHGADDDAAPQEWDPEQEVEGERAADHFGQVGRGGHDLRLDPKGDAGGLRHAVAEQGGQGLAGDEAELGGEVLDDHREDVRGHENPHEQVPVARARRDVGGDVSGVDVGDGRDEGGAE